jgi:methionine-rich copper-binding protein CopC
MALLITALLTTVLVMPPAAWAHSQLRATMPAASATVTAPIGEVTLTFNEPVHQRFSIVVVEGPGGLSYNDGPVRVVDTTVHQPVYPLKLGSYTVQWRVVSADSHPVEGRFGFTVALPAQLEPPAGPPSRNASHLTAGADDRSGSWWPWLLGLAVLTVGSVTAFRLVRRRR